MSVVPQTPAVTAYNPYGFYIKTGYTYRNDPIVYDESNNTSNCGFYFEPTYGNNVNIDFSWAEYRKCPFYIINGGMVIEGFIYRCDSERTKGIDVNNDKEGSIAWLACCAEPGRDLGVYDYTYITDIEGFETLHFYIEHSVLEIQPMVRIPGGAIMFSGIGIGEIRDPIFKSRVMCTSTLPDRYGPASSPGSFFGPPYNRAYIDWKQPIRSNIPMFGIWAANYKRNGIVDQDATVWQGHNYSVRMKINGCTNWPGATNDAREGFGYFLNK